MVIESVKVVGDTIQQVAQHVVQNGGGNKSNWMLHEILDSNVFSFEPFANINLPQIHIFGFDISITRHIIFIWLAFIINIVIFIKVSRSYKKSLVPKGFNNLMEILVVFVRDEIVKPTIGEGYEKFLPFILTLFFFILTCNLLGLVPYGIPATSNLAVTSTLAIISFIVIQGAGMMKNGALGYYRGLVPPGIPVVLIPLMFLVEFLGIFTKPFALAIRLFANMIAGHMVIFSIIGLIFVLHTYFMAPVSIGFALFLYSLEILISLIQAYIFAILSALFIGMAVHQEH